MKLQLHITIGLLFSVAVLIIGMYIYKLQNPWENFVDVGRCGPGLGVCPDGLRCINGYCKTDIAPKLSPLSDLPVRPDRYTYPVPAPTYHVSGTCADASF
jgi:hypothetical protein